MLSWQLPFLVWRAERENMHAQWNRRENFISIDIQAKIRIESDLLKYFQGKPKSICSIYWVILKNAKKYVSAEEKSLSWNVK